MSVGIKEFEGKFRTKELKIYETEHWVWSLRPIQTTIGSGILSLKRECPVFSELNQEEFSDLNSIIKIIEKTLKKTFNYDILNYLMLMMVDKQVHYHIILRYEETINFDGVYWKDLDWPGVPNLAGEEMDLSTLNEIISVIKENLTV